MIINRYTKSNGLSWKFYVSIYLMISNMFCCTWFDIMEIKICLLKKKERNLFLLYTTIYMLTCYIKIVGKMSASMSFKYTKNETYNF